MEGPPTYTLDGLGINNLDDFWVVIGEAVNGPGGYFAAGLDALNDSLGGGMGQPMDGHCTFVWENSGHSRSALGYAETTRHLEKRLASCHPTNREHVAADLREALAGRGPTAFDWLVTLFEDSPATLILR